MSFKVLTDTSANLPTPLLKQRDIGVIAFFYYIDGSEYSCLDTEKFDSKAFYDSIRGGTKVSTSLISPDKYRQAFEKYVSAGDDVVYVGMSSGISGSFSVAVSVANELMEQYPDRRIETVDTIGASLGEGFFALMAADARDAGKDARETAEELRSKVPEMCQVFTVDDLMHLRNTGRLSNAAAWVGTVLNIKPLLKGNTEGKIVSFAKALGRRRSIDMIADRYDKLVRNSESQVIGIAHADCPADVEYLIKLLNKKHPPKDIMVVDYEPVTGSHVGPGALALFFMGDADFRKDKPVISLPNLPNIPNILKRDRDQNKADIREDDAGAACPEAADGI
ncbi:MAG: DegV family protein [Clostridiales bacterium]|nr:DegV family protein [Clostridiales bacterium]